MTYGGVHKIRHFACGGDFYVLRNQCLSKVRNHANKTLLEPYIFFQKDRKHANKSDLCLIGMKMSYSLDFEPFDRNCLARIVSYSHNIETCERLNDSEDVLDM